jgi:DNA-binding response OmpR family regulator
LEKNEVHFVKPAILVVDDDANLREFYRLELEDDGYIVDLAGDANEATEKLRNDRYDVIILDIQMPGMPGMDLLQKIIARDKQQPVILNTSHAFYQNNFLAWLADAYIVKSHSTTELKEAIRMALRKKS